MNYACIGIIILAWAARRAAVQHAWRSMHSKSAVASLREIRCVYTDRRVESAVQSV